MFPKIKHLSLYRVGYRSATPLASRGLAGRNIFDFEIASAANFRKWALGLDTKISIPKESV
jgi:hypothetical protein